MFIGEVIMANYVFGIDVGGTSVKIGFFKISGKLLKNWEIPTRIECNGKNILPDIANEINKTIREMSISNSDIKGIGIGVPGPVLKDGTVNKCINLGWGVFNIEKELENLTNIKVKAANDANIAALGEMWQGGGKGYKNVVMLTLGTGIGGGIIIDEKIISGINGAAGEVGHIHICDDEEEICGCGKKGCLEQYASANGIVKVAKKCLLEKGENSTLRDIKNFTSKDIFECAKNNDTISLEIIEYVSKILGKSIAQIACVANPEVFVIGGGMSKAGDILINNISKFYKQYAFHACVNTEFRLAKLSNDAGIYGGARLVL